MDTSRRIVIIEDDDLNLDKLLLGDNSGAKSSSPTDPLPSLSSPPPSKNETSSSTVAQCDGGRNFLPASPTYAIGEKVDEVTRAETADENNSSNWVSPASVQPLHHIDESTPEGPVKSPVEKVVEVARAEKTVEDNFDYWILPASGQRGDYINDSPSEAPSKSILKKLSPAGTALAPNEKGHDDGAGYWILPASAQRGDYINDSLNKVPSKSILKKEQPASAILGQEDEGDAGGVGYWVLPPPAQLGDYLNNSLHRVPSKSILKKKSSYVQLDSSSSSSKMSKRKSSKSFCMDSSATSLRSARRSIGNQPPANTTNPLNTSLSSGKTKTEKKSSYLNLDRSSSNFSQGSQGAIGYDFDAPSPPSHVNFATPNSPNSNKVAPDPSTRNNEPIPSFPNLKSNIVDGIDPSMEAVRSGDLDSSSDTKNSQNSSAKICRNVSFHSVNVREYDRTLGDNPSCRSGPPLSLDWSYSKKYEINFEEYERERSSDRVNHIRKLHVNKYKRRNLLAFHWGHSEEEMKQARRKTKKMQRQRSMTQMALPVQKVEEAFVSIRNFIKKTSGGGKTHEGDDLSDMSTSTSTKDSHQQRRATGMPSHAPSERLDFSSHTT